MISLSDNDAARRLRFTPLFQRGESRAFVHHAFTNKTAAKGAAFNYKVTITRGASGVGGNITMIGGVIG